LCEISHDFDVFRTIRSEIVDMMRYYAA
jgi:hypothetical protein